MGGVPLNTGSTILHRTLGRRPIWLPLLLTLVATHLAVLPAPARQPAGSTAPTVQSIAVRGHREVPAERILDVITATRVGLPLDAERLQQDAQAILDLGTFQGVSFQTIPVPGGIQVVFAVEELPLLTRVILEGLEEQEGVEAVLAEAGLEEGQILDLNRVRDALATIQFQALDRHGLLVRPDPPPTWNDEGVLTLSFAPVRLNAVRAEGNEKTQEHIILRELKVRPGDPIDLNRIDRGLRNVLQLGFFDRVSRSFEETGDPGSLNLVVHVEERLTGALTFAPAWSSRDGFFGGIDISESNFLGRGQELGIRVWAGRSFSEYELRFREPYLTAGGLSLGVSLFHRNRAVDEQVGWFHDWGGGLSLGHPVGEYTRLIGTFALDHRTHDRPQEPSWVDSSNRSLELALATDTTDHPFFPGRGYRNRLSITSGGGPLGGDQTYQIYQETYSHYLTVGRWNHTLAFRIDTGLLEGDTQSTPTFAVGGSDSLRGYDYGHFNYGTRKLVVNLEYRFPLAELVQGVLFVDAGRAWTEETPLTAEGLAVGYGLGIRLSTPLGLLRLDYGMSADHPGQVYLAFGQPF